MNWWLIAFIVIVSLVFSIWTVVKLSKGKNDKTFYDKENKKYTWKFYGSIVILSFLIVINFWILYNKIMNKSSIPLKKIYVSKDLAISLGIYDDKDNKFTYVDTGMINNFPNHVIITRQELREYMNI